MKRTELATIAAKSSATDLIYGTDEDTFLNPDPRVNLFDLGDPLEFSQLRMQLVKQSLDKLTENASSPRAKVGSGPGRLFRCCWANWFGHVLSAASTSAASTRPAPTAKIPTPRLPFEPIPVAKQREAIKMLKEEILSDQAFKFSPELLKRLAPQHFREGYFYSQYEFPDLRPRAVDSEDGVVAVLRSVGNADHSERRDARHRRAGSA